MLKLNQKNKLTKKQEMFCREYVSNGHNGTQAAIGAGYSKKTAAEIAKENLIKPYIKSFIQELEQPVIDKLGVSEDWVISKLKAFSEANILDYFELDENKNIVLKDLTKLAKEKLVAIESIEQNEKGRIKIKLVGKRSSVVDIGKHLGMFKDIIEGNIQHQNLHKVYVIPAFDDNNVDR
jgi:phage terminase small subunit